MINQQNRCSRSLLSSVRTASRMLKSIFLCKADSLSFYPQDHLSELSYKSYTEKGFSHLKQWTASPNIIHSWKTFSEFPVLTKTVWKDFLVDYCMNKNASLRDIETQGWLYDCSAALIWRSMESKGVQKTESILHNNQIQHLKDCSIPQWLKLTSGIS